MAALDPLARGCTVALLREQLYKQEGLTIGGFAQKLGLPEYRVRRIINQQLGHRNFNAFLNELRTDEACRTLADPAQERLPILNLALDLGYGSLGPFNRAFKAKTDQTPTERHAVATGRRFWPFALYWTSAAAPAMPCGA